MMVFLLFLVAIAALLVAAFCAGAETGFLAVGRERILHLSREGGRKAQIIHRALSDMGRTTTQLLIGNNLASVTYSSSTAALSSCLFADNSAASAIWAFVAAFVVLYVSEFMPKLLFAARPLRRIIALADAYRVLSLVLAPLTAVAMKLTDILIPKNEQKHNLSAEDLVHILQDRKNGVRLTDFESALITRIVVLHRKKKPVTSEALMNVLRDGE